MAESDTTQTSSKAAPAKIGLSDAVKTWLPLAGSWLLMGAELPFLSAVVARLADPEINLAAYGGVVFPIALMIESPIIMLLAASTALSRDWASYQKLRSFMIRAGSLLTLLHVLIAFTPLYYLVARDIIGAPAEVIEPARIGFMIMTPWTWAIAYRRFNQGVLIRFGHSPAIVMGTAIRLLANAVVLLTGYYWQSWAGIIVATTAVVLGVTSEAVYVAWRVQPVLKHQLKPAVSTEPPITTSRLLHFYVPLALTPFFTLFAQPLLTAAISRMPRPLESLAVWPALNGLLFMIKSLGIAYNEVVVALIERPGGWKALRTFTLLLTVGIAALLILVAATPIAEGWFDRVAGLRPALAQLAGQALWIGLFVPSLTVLMSWYQGLLLFRRQTRAITESVMLFLLTCTLVLAAAVAWQTLSGLYAGLLALTAGSLSQTLWQAFRSRPLRREIAAAHSDR